MELFLFLKGLILGLSIAAPVGPIGILCIRRTLNENYLAGFISGLGAATADAVFASIAALGITLVSNFLISQQHTLRFVGGIYLSFLGIKTFISLPRVANEIYFPKTNLVSNYFTTFFLTLSNPITIISFAAIFSGFGLVNPGLSIFNPILMIVGVFFGSAIWWYFLCSIVSKFHLKTNINAMKWINRVSGLIILSFSFLAFLSLLK